MQRTKIEWVKDPDGKQGWAWNPVLGCKHGCPYCYAKRMNDRFHYIKDWSRPEFFPGRFFDPEKRKKPARILVGSMTDLFGEWVERIIIDMAIMQAIGCPQHTFMFLTKNPKRYKEFSFPKNCWLGATITQGLVDNPFGWLMPERTFISIEPLLGEVVFAYMKDIAWLIVGAMTGPGSKSHVPKQGWIENIVDTASSFNVPLFMKNNLAPYWDGELIQEIPE